MHDQQITAESMMGDFAAELREEAWDIERARLVAALSRRMQGHWFDVSRNGEFLIIKVTVPANVVANVYGGTYKAINVIAGHISLLATSSGAIRASKQIDNKSRRWVLTFTMRLPEKNGVWV